MKSIKINNFEISNDKPFTLIVGPCVIENRDHALMIAENISNICEKTNTNFIFHTVDTTLCSFMDLLNMLTTFLHFRSQNIMIPERAPQTSFFHTPGKQI